MERRRGVEDRDIPIGALVALQNSHQPRALCVGIAAACRVSGLARIDADILGVDLEGADVAVFQRGDAGRSRSRDLVEAVGAVAHPGAPRNPAPWSTWAIGSIHCRENTPIIWRFTLAGLERGPSRLKIVRVASSTRRRPDVLGRRMMRRREHEADAGLVDAAG